ncbi:MAG: hypothetical protein BWX79_03196 [Alphaproteobacteria bacterium ADurb.Bin100]|nr:MAG: hypothetical protein BWX79_03196 [Alphaproteobacteria bacterium ADurb.Bin100]
MPPTMRSWNLCTPPLRFHAAMERRRLSASPALKPAASMAICITCSWKMGTPSVRPSASRSASCGNSTGSSPWRRRR